MITSAVGNSSGQLASYFHERGVELKKLGEDLKSGDMDAAQKDVVTIQTLAQGILPSGNAFYLQSRQQDFDAVGRAMQSSDLSGARQAFVKLANSFGIPRDQVHGQNVVSVQA